MSISTNLLVWMGRTRKKKTKRKTRRGSKVWLSTLQSAFLSSGHVLKLCSSWRLLSWCTSKSTVSSTSRSWPRNTLMTFHLTSWTTSSSSNTVWPQKKLRMSLVSASNLFGKNLTAIFKFTKEFSSTLSQTLLSSRLEVQEYQLKFLLCQIIVVSIKTRAK
jgi:hypothetical protein